MPATKAIPKEMLPIIDKPLIQYAVEEAVAAGMTQLVFITNHSKRAIQAHFTSDPELESRLKQSNQELLALVQSIIPADVTFHYINQPQPLGLGDAVRRAQDVVNNQPFAVLLPDDLIGNTQEPCLKQMVELFNKTGKSIIAAEPIAREHSHRYGIVDIAASLDQVGSWAQLNGIVEKPSSDEAPSNYGVVGRYVLQPQIFHWLAQIKPGSGGEIQLTDAIAHLIDDGVYAYRFAGQHYDCGSKLGYLQATTAYALQHPQLGEPFKQFLSFAAGHGKPKAEARSPQ
ncbi:MAG: UTP--glucose-1-phosphate uridylyltransferase [Gammaproteobacteria bacterium]|nr:UTP--glucose-1-phosphate uridylyltransferase [Gammaproteobacteria bacterium]